MNEMRVLSPTGVLGSGFVESSFERALASRPHFIGCDAGSTDPGPSHLGSGQPAFPRVAVKRDLRLTLLGARRLGIPLLIGSVRECRSHRYTARIRHARHRACAIAAENGIK